MGGTLPLSPPAILTKSQIVSILATEGRLRPRPCATSGVRCKAHCDGVTYDSWYADKGEA